MEIVVPQKFEEPLSQICHDALETLQTHHKDEKKKQLWIIQQQQAKVNLLFPHLCDCLMGCVQ